MIAVLAVTFYSAMTVEQAPAGVRTPIFGRRTRTLITSYTPFAVVVLMLRTGGAGAHAGEPVAARSSPLTFLHDLQDSIIA